MFNDHGHGDWPLSVIFVLKVIIIDFNFIIINVAGTLRAKYHKCMFMLLSPTKFSATLLRSVYNKTSSR